MEAWGGEEIGRNSLTCFSIDAKTAESAVQPDAVDAGNMSSCGNIKRRDQMRILSLLISL